MDIFTPRYHDKKDNGSWTVLLACYKVQGASPIIIFTFSKAKHLQGVRKAMKRIDVMKYPLGTNGKIPCYEVPYDDLETWESESELQEIALNIFKEG